MGKHLVLVGGGHAHMVTLANLQHFAAKGHHVTVIGPSDHHYYSGMGPGMLGKTYAAEDIRFATRHVVEKYGGRFVRGKVRRIDPETRTLFLESDETVSYDVLSFNAGSFVPQDIIRGDGRNVFRVKPIEKLLEAGKQILELTSRGPARIGIVGGGPSAAEIAGNIWQLVRDSNGHMPTINIFSGNGLMAHFPEGVRRRILGCLKRRAIRISENDPVKEIHDDRISMESGRTQEVDLTFLAVGVRPSSIFKDSGLPTGPDGGLRVNRYLQSPAYPELFGGGDCIYFEEHPLDKVGVYAVRENPVLYHNLMATLEGTALEPFDPGGDYLLIFNLGGGVGVLRKKWLTVDGRLAFVIKDYIDRRFMRKFQAIE